MKPISVTVYGERAKVIMELLGLKWVGDRAEVNNKVSFEKLSAEGRNKVLITFKIQRG